MTYSDSDDFLSEPRVSKLKKKKKTKDKDIKRGKAHTSTQSEEPTVELTRGGRAARKSADEVRFMKELEEAMRLSSEDVTLSSAEIVPCQTSASGDVPAKILNEKELVTEDDCQEPPEDAESNDKPVVEDVPSTINSENVNKNDFDEVISKPVDKKRKVDSDWIVEKPVTKVKPRVKPKRIVIESSDEDEDFVDKFEHEDESDDDNWDCKKKVKTKRNEGQASMKKLKTEDAQLPFKTSNNKSKSPIKTIIDQKAPKSPLREHNRLAMMPKCQNMFQKKSPVKLKVTPRKEKVKEVLTLDASSCPSPATPGLSSTLSNILGRFNKQTPSSPAPSKTPTTVSASSSVSASPSTPVQKKLPAWTPPAKVGRNSERGQPCPSPSIGLRVGLSRNYKSKPLHPSVK